MNHFILLYNNNYPANSIYGYIGRDSSWDDYTNSNVSTSEIVWFNNEETLTPISIYFKNHIIFNQFEFYKVFRHYLRNYYNDILSQKSTSLNRHELLKLSKIICGIVDSYGNNTGFINVDKNLSFDVFLEKIDESNPRKVIIETNELFNKVSLKGGNINYEYKYIKYKSKYLNMKN